MAITDLTSVSPPPAHGGNRNVPWDEVERQLGLRLPQDYKDLIATYGEGTYGDFIHIYQPQSPYPTLDLVQRRDMDLGALRQAQEDVPEDVPFSLSDPPELLPAGLTDNGDVIYWRIYDTDDPDAWGIAVNESRGPDWHTYPDGLTRFLADTLSGRIRVSVFPRKFPHAGTAFTQSDS